MTASIPLHTDAIIQPYHLHMAEYLKLDFLWHSRLFSNNSTIHPNQGLCHSPFSLSFDLRLLKYYAYLLVYSFHLPQRYILWCVLSAASAAACTANAALSPDTWHRGTSSTSMALHSPSGCSVTSVHTPHTLTTCCTHTSVYMIHNLI